MTYQDVINELERLRRVHSQKHWDAGEPQRAMDVTATAERAIDRMYKECFGKPDREIDVKSLARGLYNHSTKFARA